MSKIIVFFERIYGAVITWVTTAQWLKIAKITVCAGVAILAVFYGAATLYQEEGTFTVGILPKSKDEDAQISLYETADFSSPTTMLSADGIDEMTNISVNWLPKDLDAIDGSHNGEHYIAYTFYVKNTGNVKCNVEETFRVESTVKGADDAIRVRLYKNGVETTYAKLGVNGQPENGTTPFAESGVVFSAINESLAEEDSIKYTLVIWLEGDDPECLDNIKGGSVKMSMTFSAEAIQSG